MVLALAGLGLGISTKLPGTLPTLGIVSWVAVISHFDLGPLAQRHIPPNATASTIMALATRQTELFVGSLWVIRFLNDVESTAGAELVGRAVVAWSLVGARSLWCEAGFDYYER